MKQGGLVLVQKPGTQASESGKAAKKTKGRAFAGGKKGNDAPKSLFKDVLASRLSKQTGKKVLRLQGKTDGNVRIKPKRVGRPEGKPQAFRLAEGNIGNLSREQEKEPDEVKKKSPVEDRETTAIASLAVDRPNNLPLRDMPVSSGPKETGIINTGVLSDNRKTGNVKKGGDSVGDRNKKEPTITLVDLRSVKDAVDPSAKVLESGGAENGNGGTGNSFEGDSSVILLKPDGSAGSVGVEEARSGEPSDFAGRLDGLLKNDLGKEIVRRTGIVVKEDGKGEIRLVLRPESLGKVRIRLDMDDNHVAAKILVENNSIRQVFEQNLDNLARMFREGGFTADSLDVFVQGDGSQNGSRDQGEHVPERLIGEMESMVPLVDDEIREETTVNMVV